MSDRRICAGCIVQRVFEAGHASNIVKKDHYYVCREVNHSQQWITVQGSLMAYSLHCFRYTCSEVTPFTAKLYGVE